MKVTDITDKKVTISVRANKHVVEKFKESEIPLSVVVEASMMNFLKMSEVDKICFVADNIPDNTDTSSFEEIDGKWTDVLKKYTENMGLPKSLMTSIFTGASVGAVTLIASAFKISKFVKDDD